MMIFLFKPDLVAQIPIKRLFLAVCLATVITGCAELFPTQTPAPVFQGGGIGARPYPEPQVYPAPTPPPAIKKPADDIKTKPLPSAPAINSVVIKPEPLPDEEDLLTPEQERELADLERAEQQATGQLEPAMPDAAPDFTPTPEIPTIPPPPPFEPLQTFAPLSPAVGALVLAANKSTDHGNLDSATTAIERAIRIEPRNAILYYKLALLRLEQDKPRLAEGLAKKSALLASGDKLLKKHSWLLIAKARAMQHNREGAEEARAQAEKY